MQRKYGDVKLNGWKLDATEKLKEEVGSAVLAAAAEALQLALDDKDTFAFMPAIWGDNDGSGGPRCDDPLTVYFAVATTEDTPIWACSLHEMLEDDIAECAADGSWSDGLARIRDALRELADRIDNALPSNEK